MPFLACVHHVQWLTRAPEGRFQCSYCREYLLRKDIYPRWEDLGPDFQAWWIEHEQTAPQVAEPSDAGRTTP